MLSGMKQTTDDPFLRFLGLTAGDSPHGGLLAEFIETVLRARDLDRGDLKILHRAVRELRYAFSVFGRFPVGFGTHDEGFEALTLLQTGKSVPMPVVFVDAPGGTYWRDWYDFIQRHMLGQGLISPSDLHLFKVTDDLDEAVSEITTFYRDYH